MKARDRHTKPRTLDQKSGTAKAQLGRERSRKAIALQGNAARNKQSLDKPLTEQQRAYVNALVRDKMNKSAAARIAGYADVSDAVYALNNNARVQHAIALEQEEFARVSAMTKKKVIDGFLEAIDMARIQADPTPMIQGWTQIAKMCGYFEPTKHKIEVSVDGNVVIQKLQQMDDGELLRLAEGDSDVIEAEFTEVKQ